LAGEGAQGLFREGVCVQDGDVVDVVCEALLLLLEAWVEEEGAEGCDQLRAALSCAVAGGFGLARQGAEV
jgi:hypothetical protein